jgi:hypothetical protein
MQVTSMMKRYSAEKEAPQPFRRAKDHQEWLKNE